MGLPVESIRNSKLLALFGTLEEGDKDIVITMTESLVKKTKYNITKSVSNNIERIGGFDNKENFVKRSLM
jgi:hypothetical protein